jgi:hypothetical protein
MVPLSDDPSDAASSSSSSGATLPSLPSLASSAAAAAAAAIAAAAAAQHHQQQLQQAGHAGVGLPSLPPLPSVTSGGSLPSLGLPSLPSSSLAMTLASGSGASSDTNSRRVSLARALDANREYGRYLRNCLQQVNVRITLAAERRRIITGLARRINQLESVPLIPAARLRVFGAPFFRDARDGSNPPSPVDPTWLTQMKIKKGQHFNAHNHAAIPFTDHERQSLEAGVRFFNKLVKDKNDAKVLLCCCDSFHCLTSPHMYVMWFE